MMSRGSMTKQIASAPASRKASSAAKPAPKMMKGGKTKKGKC